MVGVEFAVCAIGSALELAASRIVRRHTACMRGFTSFTWGALLLLSVLLLTSSALANIALRWVSFPVKVMLLPALTCPDLT